jgi:hypothetical protein
MQAMIIAVVLTFLVNLPFGYWRAGTRKFSGTWFLAVHGPVPLVVAVRLGLGLPFQWTTLPPLVAAYFAGQIAGARMRRPRGLDPQRRRGGR